MPGVLLLIAALAGCGGGSSPAAPSPLPTSSGANPCDALSLSGNIATAITNGTACSTANSPVVLVNLYDSGGIFSGSCSGTVISTRAVLTAAHCLIGGTASVKIYLDTGIPLIPAQAFTAAPNYQESDPTSLDVGVIRFANDIGRPPMPLLVSRDARVGEAAVIAGWSAEKTLRAGGTTITVVGPTLLQTDVIANASAVCPGDSGGPLLLSQGGAWAIAGVTSAATTTACSFGTSYYANIRNSAIRSFIIGLVKDAATR